MITKRCFLFIFTVMRVGPPLGGSRGPQCNFKRGLSKVSELVIFVLNSLGLSAGLKGVHKAGGELSLW